MSQLDQNRVFITGMGVTTRDIHSIHALSKFLRAGKTAVRPIPESDPTYPVLKVGHLITDTPANISFNDLVIDKSCDAFTRACRKHNIVMPRLLHAIAQAVTASRLTENYASKDIMLIIAGGQTQLSSCYQAYQVATDGMNYLSPRYATELMDSSLIGVITECFGLNGPSFTVSNASASGNCALYLAKQLLMSKSSGAVIIAAPPMMLSPVELHSLNQSGALAHDACSSPFDHDRTGFNYAQMGASLVLEKSNLEHQIELCGTSLCVDAKAGTTPQISGQVQAMHDAVKDAMIKPSDIAYVNAHATGSCVGDEIEVASINKVFNDCDTPPTVNSTKSLLGHGISSASVIEAIATILQLQEQYIHAHPVANAPIETVNLPSVSGLTTTLEYVMSNAFAFGGISSSCIFRRHT